MSSEAPTAGRSAPPVRLRAPRPATPVVLAGAGVLAQIVQPLLDGHALTVATVLSVLLLFVAALAHAAAAGGVVRVVTVAVVAGGLGFAAEAVGVRTGVPFGSYHYTGELGPQLAGVPLLVPAAWAMLGYPCLLLGRRLFRGRAGTALAGGLALASWDLFLDPQLVAQGAWVWHHPSPSLPGVPGIPLTNYAGWVLVAIVLVAALDAALPRDRPAVPEAGPAVVLAWTWLGSTIGNLAFFDRPWVAVWGGAAMAVPVLPYLARLRARP